MSLDGTNWVNWVGTSGSAEDMNPLYSPRRIYIRLTQLKSIKTVLFVQTAMAANRPPCLFCKF